MNKLKLFLCASLLVFIMPLNAQNTNKNKSAKKEKGDIETLKNWYNADHKKDKKVGVSTEHAYAELLKDKKSRTIIVAVIDAGVDIYHEDLKEVLWVNTDEIPANGIDDDKNGFVDDINGWSFLGHPTKGNVVNENMELTREYARLKAKDDDGTLTDVAEIAYYKNIKERYESEYKAVNRGLTRYGKLYDKYNKASEALKGYLKKDTITFEDVNAMTITGVADVDSARKHLLQVFSRISDVRKLKEAVDYYKKEVEVSYNVDLNARAIVGDNPDNIADSLYGNNDVKGEHSFHGTFVAGFIAAQRNNGIGINGIADNVKIMALRTIPDGDERDKDVALAIRYAVNNGANIINMSFGKEFSPNSKWVFDAIDYAAKHNVLLVHAAGNDSDNNDSVPNFPSSRLLMNTASSKVFIEVGASAINASKDLVALFSNYGIQTVDVFAPGKDVYSTTPENKYEVASGTSFSCPVVSGIAALIWSYYPNLTAVQVKEIIVKSGVDYSKKKVYMPNKRRAKDKKVKFGLLSKTGKVVNVYNALKMAEKY